MAAIGKFSKHETTIDNGKRVIYFATDKGICVISTFLEDKEIHKETWISPDDIKKNQIDNDLVESRHATNIW